MSLGRPSEEAALLRRRRVPLQKGRPRRRRGCAALPSSGACRDPAGLLESGRLRFAPGTPTQSWPKQCPGAALPKRRPSCTAGGRPYERGAHADGVDTRPCPAEGRAFVQPSSPKMADSDGHRARLFRGRPNSVVGPPNQRGGLLVPPACALTKGAPTPTACMRGPAQKRDRTCSSRAPRR